MKTLLLIRHAKSSWDNAHITDMERPLNDRGRHDAPIMAQRLIKANIKMDLFVSSPARRAKTTAGFFVQEFGRKESEIRILPELYHASVQAFKEVVSGLDESAGSAAIFSHNPGITAFVNTLTSVRLDNMPTCGIFAVTSLATQWSEFLTAGTTFWFFDYPKKE
jgi:phosphohistidine phosphatase